MLILSDHKRYLPEWIHCHKLADEEIEVLYAQLFLRRVVLVAKRGISYSIGLSALDHALTLCANPTISGELDYPRHPVLCYGVLMVMIMLCYGVLMVMIMLLWCANGDDGDGNGDGDDGDNGDNGDNGEDGEDGEDGEGVMLLLLQ